MGSNDERSPVTLQIQLMDQSTIYVPTELDLTVENFKLILVDVTGVPFDEQWLVHTGRILRNPRTLRSYELDPEESIHLVRISPSPPSTSVGSMPGEQTPYKIIPWFVNQDAIANIIEDIPFLSWLAQNPNWAIALQHPVMLHNVLLFHLGYEINARLAMELEFLKADVSDNIKADTEGSHKLKSVYEIPTVPKVACMYDVQFGIPFGTEENQLSLGLFGWSLVDTSGRGPESSNANQSESATNSNPFSGPEAESSNANQSELATNNNPFSGPEAESSNANQSELETNNNPFSGPEAESSNANQSELATNNNLFSGPEAESSNANQSELETNNNPFSGPEAESSNANQSELATNNNPFSGPEAESSNANQSELATNSNPFSGPEAESSNANQSELATNSNPFSGPEAESSNANQSELVTNSNPFSGPEAESSNANLSKSGPNTEPLPNPWAPRSYREGSSSQMEQVSDSDDESNDDESVDLSYWEKVYTRSVDILVPIILSDATLLRHCKEQGESVGRAFTAMLEAHNISQDSYNSAFNFLVNEVNVYFHLILEKFHPLQHYAGYGSGASNDGVTGISTPEVAAPEEVFASQLAQMEQMGFMDTRENIIALLSCWGGVKKAVEMLNSKKAKS